MAVGVDTLTKERKEEALQVLFAAANGFTGEEAVSKFIKHFMTESEQITVGRRIQIAALLRNGMSQAEVRRKLGVSPSTFSRTRAWLEREIPNYGDAVKARKKQQAAAEEKRQEERERRQPVQSGSFAALKRKYPMESLLFNLADKLRGK